jgi:hypothetical protein
LDFSCGKAAKKHQTNQSPAKALFEPVDRGSAFKPVWRVVAGPPLSLANLIIPLHGLPPRRLNPEERAELIKKAHELEHAARWPLTGLKPNGGR